MDPTFPVWPIFNDGFESGDLANWSPNEIDGGNLSVTAQAKIIGSYGLNLNVNDNNSLYVTDQTPSALSHYRSRFYMVTNDLAMLEGDSFYLFQGLDSISSTFIRLEMRYSLGDYHVRGETQLDGGAWSSTPWTTIADGTHLLETDWRGSIAAGANNGYFKFWVDNSLTSSVRYLDNDTKRVDSVRLGAVDGIDTGTRGSFYLDDYISRQESYIGPDHAGPELTGLPDQNAIFDDGFEFWNTFSMDKCGHR